MVFGETVILDTVTLNCCMIILWGVCFCLLKRLGLQANLIESFKIDPYFTSQGGWWFFHWVPMHQQTIVGLVTCFSTYLPTYLWTIHQPYYHELRKIWGCESKKSLMQFFQVVCYLDMFIIIFSFFSFFLAQLPPKFKERYCRPPIGARYRSLEKNNKNLKNIWINVQLLACVQ